MRYLATISYVGTNYAGWQIQVDAVSIQEEIEKVLSKILNSKIKIYGSGRTDAGVHSIGQTFHFDAKEIKDLNKFKYSLNSLLPDDMHVTELRNVKEDFHARYNVKAKVYSYYTNIGEYNPFKKDLEYQLLRQLDLLKMKKALELFKGQHCFQNFTSKVEDEKLFIREIYETSLSLDNNVVKITFCGSGFMRYMVRMIVGTLIEVGLGRLEIDRIQNILDNSKREVVSYKAPACGLYLEKVIY